MKADFAKGGNTKMFQNRGAVPSEPGQSIAGGGADDGSKFAKGGSGKMFGPQAAGPQIAGCTSHETNGDGGKFAKGGTTKMFGPQTAATARPA